MQSREQTGRRLRGPLAVLVAAMVAGTVGFMLIEGWSLGDAVYMVVITLTTVGYGEVHPLSGAGQAFTVLLLLVGVGAISYSFSVLVAVIFDGYVNQRWEQRRMTRRIDQLADHYIICGYGRVGREIAAQLQREGHTCLVVDQRSDALERAVKDGFLAVEGNASEDETLRRAGIARATGLITAVQTDAENIFVTLSARALRAEMPIVARANYEDAMPKLRRAGATQVVSPYAMAGQQMARLAARPATVGFVEKLLEGAKGDLLLEELRIEEGSPLATTTLAEARRRFGGDTVVLAVRRGERLLAPPPRDLALQPDDTLAAVGTDEQLRELALACQTPAAAPTAPVAGEVAIAPASA